MLTEDMKNFITKLPKIDLHCHIDGSLPIDFVRNITNRDDDNLIKELSAPIDCDSLATYLTCFDLPIACLNTYERIERAVLSILESAAKENVKYIELRYSPELLASNSLSVKGTIKAAISGCQKAFSLYGIHSNIIICAMRHHSIETNLKVLHDSMEFLGNGVCAFDLAGNEAAFDNALFIPLFHEAKHLGMPFTIHSGECGSSENIRLAIDMGAARIGHGIALVKDFELLQECKRKDIGLELCPTSNYQTKAVKNGETYPLRTFLDNQLLATINTDNRTVSSTNSTDELMFIVDRFSITKKDLITITKNSIEISFAEKNIKNELLHALEEVI